MVEKHSYRVLASYSYDAHEKPLRSERIAEEAPVTDAASDIESVVDSRSITLPARFKNVSSVPEHEEFIQLVINAKVVATIEGSAAPVHWRGYRTTVFPEFEMTTDNLRHELLNALQCLTELSDTERKVITA